MVVGDAAHVADELQSWVADTGIDGFNLAYVESPRTFEDIVRLLIPELQRRGLIKRPMRRERCGRNCSPTALIYRQPMTAAAIAAITPILVNPHLFRRNHAPYFRTGSPYV